MHVAPGRTDPFPRKNPELKQHFWQCSWSASLPRFLVHPMCRHLVETQAGVTARRMIALPDPQLRSSFLSINERNFARRKEIFSTVALEILEE